MRSGPSRRSKIAVAAIVALILAAEPVEVMPAAAEPTFKQSQALLPREPALPQNTGAIAAMMPVLTIATTVSTAGSTQTFTVKATSSEAATATAPITVIDFTDGTLLKTCTSGTTCSVNTSFISTEARQYIARHGQSETEPVTVTPAPWSMTLSTSREIVSAGETFNLDLVTDRNPYTVREVWGVRIVDVGNGEVFSECTGTTSVTGGFRCRAPMKWFPDDSREFRGELYDKSSGEVLRESNIVIVTSKPWILSVSTDTQVLGPDEQATLTVHSNQQIYSIRSQYVVHIIDEGD